MHFLRSLVVYFTEKCFSKTADMYLEWDHAENGVPLLKRKEVVHIAHKQVRREFLTVQVYIVRQKRQLG